MSFWKRTLLAGAGSCFLGLAMTLIDAFVWKWLPTAAYVITPIYMAAVLPWAVEGQTWLQLLRSRKETR